MKKFLLGAVATIALAWGLALAGSQNLPVPSNVVASGEIVVGVDDFNVRGTTTPAISGSLTVGSAGTAVSQVKVFSADITPAQVATNVCSEQTFTVTGVATTDSLFFNRLFADTITSAQPIVARVSGANTVGIIFCNVGAASSTPTAGPMEFIGIRTP